MRLVAAVLAGTMMWSVPGLALPEDGPSRDSLVSDVPRQASTFLMSNSPNPSRPDLVMSFGRPTDTVLVGDWNGDGIDTVALRRGDTFIVTNSHSGHDAFEVTFGRAGDEVFAGDWNGDGFDTFAIRRGNTIVMQDTLASTTGTALRFGQASDEMFVGDWDGDGIDSFAIRRGQVFHVANGTGGKVDHAFGFGRASDTVIIGDWGGTGKSSIGLRRENKILASFDVSSRGVDHVMGYGRSSDEVFLGDWDGDGRQTLMVRRTSVHSPTLAANKQRPAMMAPKDYRANVSTRPSRPLDFPLGRGEMIGRGWGANSTNMTAFARSPIVSGIDPNGDEIQFVAYYDSQANLVLARKNVTQNGDWRRQISQYSGTLRDGHNSISMGIDRSGYLHIAWGMHGAPMQYTVSTRPWSTELAGLRPVTGKLEERVTYPEFHTTSSGNMFMIYRAGTSGDGNLVVNFYDAATGEWSQVQKNLIDGKKDGLSPYWQATLDSKDRLHLSWTWRRTPDVTTNHDYHYAVSDPSGKRWYTSDGEQYALPITAASAEKIATIAEGSDLMNQTDMTVDEADRPYIVSSWRGSNDTIQYKLLYRTAGGWVNEDMGLRTTDFTLDRPGSKLREMGRPKIFVTGRDDHALVRLLVRDVDYFENAHGLITYQPGSGLSTAMALTRQPVNYYEPVVDHGKWRRSQQIDVLISRTGGVKTAPGDYPAQDVYLHRVPDYVIHHPDLPLRLPRPLRPTPRHGAPVSYASLS